MREPTARTSLPTPGDVDEVELRVLRLPMSSSFATAGGVLEDRTLVVVRVRADGVDGWAECSALPEPTYAHEYVEGAFAVLHGHLVPRLWDPARPEIVGHPMAAAALRTARLDAALRRDGRSLADAVGATRERVDAGAAVGLAPDVDTLMAEVSRLRATGYRRLKLKIEPGRDVEPVAAVRDLVGPDVVLQVDANGAYRLDDPGVAALAALDGFGLACIEQPLPADDLLGHAELARNIATPVCLDETLTSPTVVAQAIALGACSVVCVKPGRLGGVAPSLAVHHHCRENGVDAWLGGMVESGIGRATLLGLAGLPGFTLPGDLSATGRWFADDLTSPVALDADGMLPVPTGPGIGEPPDPDAIERFTIRAAVVRPSAR